MSSGSGQGRRRILGALRAVLALACLGVQLTAATSAAWPNTAAAAVFAAYSLAALAWRHAERRGAALLGLILDTVFFLVFAHSGTDPGGWFSTVFYFYLLLAAVVLHSPWDVCVVAGVSSVVIVVSGSPARGVLGRTVVLCGSLAAVLAFLKAGLERSLARALREAAGSRAQAERAGEAERQRVAGDFHDGPLQGFISLQIRLEVLKKLLIRDHAAGLRELEELRDFVRSQAREMRAFLRGMQPVAVESDSVPAMLRRVVADFQKDSGISATLQCADRIEMNGSEASAEVMQLVREALTNIRKHSGATRVAVTAVQAGRLLEISIEDNGQGFAFGGAFVLDELDALHMGPLSIRRRVRNLGGELSVESRPGLGAGLRVRVPI